MSPARRSLAALKAAGRLEAVPADPQVIANLLQQVGNHLVTAGVVLTTDSEGAFALAYDAWRKTCTALLNALQLRPTGDGAHVTSFQAAAAAAHSFGARQLVEDAADLRSVRPGAEYRGNVIDTADAVAVGGELLQVLLPNIKRILAGTS